jgi:hypothetical protein
MSRKVKDDRFSEQETAYRFEAALRGALSTPPKPLKDIPKKRPKKPKRQTRSGADASS